MSATRSSAIFLPQTKKIGIGAVALLAIAGPALSAEAPPKDEVLTLAAAIQTPTKLTSFDISYFDPVLKKYFLGDRSSQAVDIFDTTTNKLKPSAAVFSSGPNGVFTVNNKEIWAGDGNSKVQVLDAVTGLSITSISTLGTMGADEGCFDPVDQLVVIANNKESPYPWISFIATGVGDPNRYKVVKQIVFNGLPGTGTVPATNGIEQCNWDAKTGKIYLNIPEVNGSGNDSSQGAVAVIDPVSKSVEKVFMIPLSACAGPMGQALGPENQILLGCSQHGTNSAIINKNSGAVESVLTGYAGTDEVWFNSGDGHYILPFCPLSCRATASPTPEQIGVIDAKGFRADQSVTIASTTTTPGTGTPPPAMRRVKSVAADPNTNKVYIPIPAVGGGAPAFAPTICSSAPTKIGSPTDATGCIAVFTAGE